MARPLIAVSTGEPAGIGPDICAVVASEPAAQRLAFLADAAVMEQRARALGLKLTVRVREVAGDVGPHQAGTMQVLHCPSANPVEPGRLDAGNSNYVLDLLRRGTRMCLDEECAALVTAPVQKSVITESGTPFSGHTEFLAELAGIRRPVMLLAGPRLKVALVTTHLPLREVADAVTGPDLELVLRIVHAELHQRFGIDSPRLSVLGLNPHAGESGTLGTEDRDVIAPVIRKLAGEGLRVQGPTPADTAFTTDALKECDVVVAMYHDQGLPVIKASDFGDVVNVTLGLPFIRTSVDHGTALRLAGTGRGRPDSLRAAIALAAQMLGTTA